MEAHRTAQLSRRSQIGGGSGPGGPLTRADYCAILVLQVATAVGGGIQLKAIQKDSRQILAALGGIRLELWLTFCVGISGLRFRGRPTEVAGILVNLGQPK